MSAIGSLDNLHRTYNLHNLSKLHRIGRLGKVGILGALRILSRIGKLGRLGKRHQAGGLSKILFFGIGVNYSARENVLCWYIVNFQR